MLLLSPNTVNVGLDLLPRTSRKAALSQQNECRGIFEDLLSLMKPDAKKICKMEKKNASLSLNF